MQPGFAKVTGGTIYYLYEPPRTIPKLKAELSVLEEFLGAWNADNTVSLPFPFTSLSNGLTTDSGYQWYIAVKHAGPSTHNPFIGHVHRCAFQRQDANTDTNDIKREMIHSSLFSSDEDHITALIVIDASWDLSTKDRGAVIHIYPSHNDSDVVLGHYNSYYIQNSKVKHLQSHAITEAISAAESNDLGTLGEGNLA